MRIIPAAATSLLLAAVAGGYFYKLKYDTALTATEPALSPSPQPTELPRFTITAVQDSDDQRRVITCEHTRCRSLEHSRPELADALTDGQRWYYYREQKNEAALVRENIQSGEVTIISATTRLTTPRGLYISPDNRKLAYWLDNIDQPEKQLTELWLYDTEAGGTQVLAEKINRAAVLTEPRFNRASSAIWFVGDTGEPGENPRPELLVAALQPPQLSARHLNHNWQKLQDVAARGVMDLSPDGSAVAYGEVRRDRQRLNVSREGEKAQTALAKGNLVHLHWRDNDTLLYIIQEPHYFSFWQTDGGLHRQLSRHPGTIESVRAAADGRYLVFAARHNNRTQAIALDTEEHLLIPQGPLPAFGSRTYIVHVEQQQPANRVAGITTRLDDSQLAAFVEKHLAGITQDAAARHQRLIVTDQPNTILLDYTAADGQLRRLLLTVRDALHAEWSVRARYREAAGEWVRTDGSSQEQPRPLRLYEWEPGPNQWIFKEEL